jgi:hypothetical protein
MDARLAQLHQEDPNALAELAAQEDREQREVLETPAEVEAREEALLGKKTPVLRSVPISKPEAPAPAPQMNAAGGVDGEELVRGADGEWIQKRFA